MDGTKQTTNWIIAGLVALVVIIGGGWLIARERSGTLATDMASSTETVSASGTEEDSETVTPSTSPATPAETVRRADATASAMGETITVEDQPAGANVLVADVKLSKPAFIAIRDTRGWYPGWQYVTGSQANVSIPLKRNTEAGRTYEAVIFIDDGDGSFELHGGDMLVTGTEGAPVSTTFTAK